MRAVAVAVVGEHAPDGDASIRKVAAAGEGRNVLDGFRAAERGRARRRR
jgi:hypothetical protein